MVHYGKHIIDNQTGLCEICDRGAIHEFRRGKRTGKQFLYSNQDGKFTYRSNNSESFPPIEEQTPRFVRKPLYPEPPPSIRTRQQVQEDTTPQEKRPQGTHSSGDDYQPRLTTFYYVNNEGQMHPRNEGPSHESPRQVQPMQNYQPPRPQQQTRTIPRRAQTPPPPVSETWPSPPKRQNKLDADNQQPRLQQQTRTIPRRAQTPPPPVSETWRSPPKRQNKLDADNQQPRLQQPTRTTPRRAQTPPPPVNETWRSPPKRQNKYDTETQPQQSYRAPPNDVYYDQPSRKVELYYIERPNDHFTTINSPVASSYETQIPPIKNTYQVPDNRKARQPESAERKYYAQPEQTFVKKVYRKLPDNQSKTHEDEFVPAQYNPQTVRKADKHNPSFRTYDSMPQLNNQYNETNSPTIHPMIYHIQSQNVY